MRYQFMALEADHFCLKCMKLSSVCGCGVTKTIVLTHTCGHTHRFGSPGILDPSGNYGRNYTAGKTGEIHLKKTTKCYWCLKETPAL